MKKKCVLACVLALLLLLTPGCGGNTAGSGNTAAKPAVDSHGVVEISFSYTRQGGIANNQFAVWVEDAKGNFIKTLYVTNFTGKGGYKQRPEALPEWVKRSGAAASGQADLTSGATPGGGVFKTTWDCTKDGASVAAGEYSFFVEGTVAWKDDLYKGTIQVGDTGVSATAETVSKNSDKNDMIGPIQIIFTPSKAK